jgi:hypothetical protein
MRSTTLVNGRMFTVCVLIYLQAAAIDAYPAETSVRLNGIDIGLDADTGAIVRIAYPGVGTILEASSDKAGLLELAYPLAEFEPLRLASRFSKARIKADDQGVTIDYDRLGSSRKAFDQRSNVSATVTLKAADDGKSVVFSCRIHNRSDQPVPQALFPDLVGLLPTAGEADTQLRTCGTVISPWTEMRSSPSGQFWVEDQDVVVLKPGRLLGNMVFRWLDLSSSIGGFSMFAKRWGWDPLNSVYADMEQRTMRLRLLWEHADAIAPGQTYESGEFWLTPHRHGWAEGIEAYRRWFKANYRRPYSLPDRIRNGLGYRTVWMSTRFPGDPEGGIVWRFKDIPDVATEAKEHGLAEVVAWAWTQGFHLPIPAPYPQLGTIDEFLSAAEKSRSIGAPVSLFVTILGADRETAKRHGYEWRKRGSYTRHVDLLPRRGAWYTKSFDYSYADVRNANWQSDARGSLKALIDKGFTDLTWDQVKLDNHPEPNMAAAIKWIRDYARQKAPDASFGGESTSEPEIDLELIDFTWNWRDYSDTRPLISLLTDGPRINANINRSIPDVVRAFADNLYLNVMPRKPDHINGSDWIKNHPDLSRTLKQCAELRWQFLPYFTQGRLVGECVLAEPNSTIHLTAYILEDKVLAIAVNTAQQQTQDLKFDVGPWLKDNAGPLEVRVIDQKGRLVASNRQKSRQFTVVTPSLEQWDLCIMEMVPPGK